MGKNILAPVMDVDRLPTLPSIAIEAMRLMEGEHSSFDSIADLLKNDQVLASRILHYANSAFVGGKKISSISHAVSMLGFNAVRSIILSVSIFDCFSQKFARQKQGLVNFWLHSIGVAATAEIMARRLGFPSPEEAYLAGLVHDMGKLVCFIQFPEEFERVCRELDQGSASANFSTLPLDIEKNIMGVDHIEAGRQVAEHWGFPEPLARAIWLHHQPVYETIQPAAANLAQLIRFADVLCVTHYVGSSYFLSSGAHCSENFHFALENLVLHHHLTPADIAGIMNEVHGRIKEIGSVLGFWDEEVYRKLIRSANVSLGSMSMNLEKSNRRLAETNQVLQATCNMSRQLKASLSLTETAEAVGTAARKAFGVSRCLCLIRDDLNQVFTGVIFDGAHCEEISVPLHPEEMHQFRSQAGSDIEAQAVEQLERTTLELSRGGSLESGMMSMVAGSRFLATFFVADRQSRWAKEPVLGELMVDFAGSLDFHGESFAGLSRNFEALALTAGNGVERILLEKDLSRQAETMAESSRKMEESQRQLFHSHRLATVGSLAAGAAHEINNPLTIISLNIQIIEKLLRRSGENQALLDRLQTIGEQERRISKIIQELMGFARPSQPKFCPSRLSDIAAKVLSVIGDRVSMKKIEIKNLIPEELPLVMVDPLQVEQVLMNLLINANHAMPDGGDLILAAHETHGFIEVTVADTGEGIPPENLGKIFDPFFTTKKEGEGTGLGLAICHSIVEHNGGVLRAKSEFGKGSTFFMTLPVDKGSRLRQMKVVLDEQAQAETFVAAREKTRILVIDDERLLNDMLQDSLREVGYEADGAYDGVEGMGLLRYKKYRLVLLDIRMPRKDGLEVLKFIREQYPDLKVVIITGLASMEEIKETVKQGAFACLKKPFRLEKVLETIGKALQDEG